MFITFPPEFNQLSLSVLCEVLNSLHNKVTNMFKNSYNEYLIYKLKELKSYLYDLTVEFGLIDDSYSSYLYDLKLELVRVEKELVYLELIEM